MLTIRLKDGTHIQCDNAAELMSVLRQVHQKPAPAKPVDGMCPCGRHKVMGRQRTCWLCKREQNAAYQRAYHARQGEKIRERKKARRAVVSAIAAEIPYTCECGATYKREKTNGEPPAHCPKCREARQREQTRVSMARSRALRKPTPIAQPPKLEPMPLKSREEMETDAALERLSRASRRKA